MQRSSPFLFMLEKWTKRFASKATDSALEGVTKTLNEKVGPHIDVIQIGLVFGVIALGTHIAKRKINPPVQAYLPNGQPPIVINNYYREREDVKHYEQRNSKRGCYLQNGQVCGGQKPQGQTYSKR